MEIASFEKFLTDKIKVGNKTGERVLVLPLLLPVPLLLPLLPPIVARMLHAA